MGSHDEIHGNTYDHINHGLAAVLIVLIALFLLVGLFVFAGI